MDDKVTATLRPESTYFWDRLRHGVWPKAVSARLVWALDTLVQRLRGLDDVVGIIVFGSYARGEFGRTSDVDLLIAFHGQERPELTPIGQSVLRVVGDVTAEARLPMDLSPLLISIDRPEDLGPDLISNIWGDGVILYGRMAALARLQPPGLNPWVIVRFSVARASPTDRVRLSRRLHGTGGRRGIVRSPSIVLGPGALLAHISQRNAIRDALDESGATYDFFPIWRES